MTKLLKLYTVISSEIILVTPVKHADCGEELYKIKIGAYRNLLLYNISTRE